MANTAINHDPVATFPGSSTNTAVVKWSGTSGNALLDSGVIIDGSNNVTGLNNVTATGYLHLTGDEKELRFYEGANYIAIAAPSGLGADYTFTLPLNDGAASEFLQTDGNGVLVWAAVHADAHTVVSHSDTSITGAELTQLSGISANVTDTNLNTLTDGSSTTSLHAHAGGGPSQATQSALVAETNEDTYAPPDLMKHHPGITKVWDMTNAAGTIETPDYGVSTIGDTGTGNRRVNFSQAFNGTKFGKQVTGDLAGGGERASGVSTAATDAMIYNSSNSLQDSETFFSAWGIF